MLATVRRVDIISDAHLISDPPDPLLHLGDGLLVPSRAELLDGFHNGEVALQRIESCDGRVVVAWPML